MLLRLEIDTIGRGSEGCDVRIRREKTYLVPKFPMFGSKILFLITYVKREKWSKPLLISSFWYSSRMKLDRWWPVFWNRLAELSSYETSLISLVGTTLAFLPKFGHFELFGRGLQGFKGEFPTLRYKTDVAPKFCSEIVFL